MQMQVQRDRALASSAPKDGYMMTIGSPANSSPEATDEMSPVPETMGKLAAVKMRHSRLMYALSQTCTVCIDPRVDRLR